MSTGAVTCQALVEALLELYDGDLEPSQAHHLKHHLENCPPCLALLSGYEEVVATLERLPASPPQPGFLERLRQHLAAAE